MDPKTKHQVINRLVDLLNTTNSIFTIYHEEKDGELKGATYNCLNEFSKRIGELVKSITEDLREDLMSFSTILEGPIEQLSQLKELQDGKGNYIIGDITPIGITLSMVKEIDPNEWQIDDWNKLLSCINEIRYNGPDPVDENLPEKEEFWQNTINSDFYDELEDLIGKNGLMFDLRNFLNKSVKLILNTKHQALDYYQNELRN